MAFITFLLHPSQQLTFTFRSILCAMISPSHVPLSANATQLHKQSIYGRRTRALSKLRYLELYFPSYGDDDYALELAGEAGSDWEPISADSSRVLMPSTAVAAAYLYTATSAAFATGPLDSQTPTVRCLIPSCIYSRYSNRPRG